LFKVGSNSCLSTSYRKTLAALTHPKKHLSFTALRKMLSTYFSSIDDPRQQSKCLFTQHDVLMSAFSCMYFQEPSFAEFQRKMEIKKHISNLRTLFNVTNIPKESQLRDLLDEIPPDIFDDIFKELFSRLRRHKHLEDFAILPNILLCVIDGTQYHSSSQIHCKHCLSKTHKEDQVTYSHAVLQGAL